MKQSRHSSRWKSQFFRLDDGFLTCYDMKSLVGTTPNKVKQAEQGIPETPGFAPRRFSLIVLACLRILFMKRESN